MARGKEDGKTGSRRAAGARAGRCGGGGCAAVAVRVKHFRSAWRRCSGAGRAHHFFALVGVGGDLALADFSGDDLHPRLGPACGRAERRGGALDAVWRAHTVAPSNAFSSPLFSSLCLSAPARSPPSIPRAYSPISMKKLRTARHAGAFGASVATGTPAASSATARRGAVVTLLRERKKPRSAACCRPRGCAPLPGRVSTHLGLLLKPCCLPCRAARAEGTAALGQASAKESACMSRLCYLSCSTGMRDDANTAGMALQCSPHQKLLR